MAFIVRPARHDDVEGLLDLAKNAGTGMTTVPQTEEAIRDRIEASLVAFSGQGKARANETFYFVLDDGEGVCGMACIFPDLGADRPFYSYRLSKVAAQAPELGLTASTDILMLVNDFHGYTEIGTLLVGERARGKGAGRLLSLSRFLYIAGHRDRFTDHVMAEIRGWFDEDGHCPFWENIAAKFFHTSFEEADRLSAHDFRFISHLMPKFPIYASLLPKEAQDSIGTAHPTSSRAKQMLEDEGLSWTRCIDIFDGGPSLEAPIDQVRTVARATKRPIRVDENESIIPNAEPFLVATQAPDTFAATIGYADRAGKTVRVSPEAAELAGWRRGTEVLASPLKRKTTT